MDPLGTFAASLIRSAPQAYAAGAAERLTDDSGDSGLGSFTELREEFAVRLQYLAEALALGVPAVFVAHVGWTKAAFAARRLPAEYLPQTLAALSDELAESMPQDAGAAAGAFLRQALDALPGLPEQVPSILDRDGPLQEERKRYLLAVLENRRSDALAIVKDALAAGASVGDVLEHIVSAAQIEMGRMWQMDEVNIAEEHFGSRIAEFVLANLQAIAPRPARNGRRVLLTAPSGNLHDLGLRIVAEHFEMAGWEPLLMGANVPVGDILTALRHNPVDLVALGTNTFLQIGATAEVIQAIAREPSLQGLPVLVGGGPFQQVPELVEAVGADAVAVSADHAVSLAESLVAG